MTNKEAIKLIQEIEEDGRNVNAEHIEALDFAIKALEERSQSEWIPVTYRPMTEEERIDFAEYCGIEYCDTVGEKILSCQLPEDGQEILVSHETYVSEDICELDGCLYNLENNGDWDGITAWMPKPKPYKAGSEYKG